MSELNARYLSDYQPAPFQIKTVNLTFNLEDQATIVTNEMHITRVGNHGLPLVLDGEQLRLISVNINGNEVSSDDYLIKENELELLTNEQEFVLTIVTEINPIANTSLEGLFKSGDAFCTQCEAEGFRRITYYLDRPDVMASFTTEIIADKKQYPFLLSNGNEVGRGNLSEGKHFVKWQDPFLKPCYLFALVAGDFDLLQDSYITCSGRKVNLEIFVDKGNKHKAHHAMASLKHSMKWDEDTFGLEYDLDIYMIVAVDFFNMGAMENKGLNVFNSKYVLADNTTATDTDYFNIEAVIGHEYFHNWTGNRVTCRDWFQLSLKEGLTVFRDQQFSADMHSSAVTRIQNVRVLRSQQFAEDAGPMAHPIRPEKVLEMNNFYTLTVYEKGSEVIRMLHTLLGKENFRKGMDLYFSTYDGMAVTCDDFVNAMSEASNIDLSQFKLWYSQAGTPCLSISDSYDAKEKTYSITISQSNQANNKNIINDPLHIPLKIEVIEPVRDHVSEHLIELKQAQQSWTFKQIETPPVLAFLANFSAPVKVESFQSDEQLEIVIMNALDPFCRWDASQKLLASYIKKLTLNPEINLPNIIIDIFIKILNQPDDNAFKAEQLILPTFDEVAESIEEVNPISLVNAIDKLKLFLATGLEEQLISTYHECQTERYTYDKQAIANRALKNVCLSYLSLLPKNSLLLDEQFSNSDNMTDTLSVLNSAAKNNFESFDQFMSTFENRWHATPLVMDKWFTIKASLSNENIFEQLDTLLVHPLFSLNNPNRARSLISAFCSANPRYFHCISGRGYKFLSNQIEKLNDINPQVASRLITPLIQFKGFDIKRQKLMLSELVRLRKLPNLTKDLIEKLDASLK